MRFLRYTPGPLEYWLGEALTEFVNGFIAGLGSGSIVGAGVGATTAGTSVGEGVSALNQVILSAVTVALSATGNGLKSVMVWHHNHPFPNIWPKAPKDGAPPPAV